MNAKEYGSIINEIVGVLELHNATMSEVISILEVIKFHYLQTCPKLS